MREVLLAGASGVIGGQVLTRLLADPSIDRVIVLVRHPLQISHDRLEQRQVDFAALDALVPDFRVDTAFCCLGTTMRQAGSQAAFRAVDQDAVLAFARLAQRAGAMHFLAVSAVGADVRSPSFYSRVKGEVEAALSGLSFSRLTLLQPSLLLGPREEKRVGERFAQIVSTPFAPLMAGPLSRYRPIHSATVAAAMVAAARDNTPGRTVLQWQELTRLASLSS